VWTVTAKGGGTGITLRTYGRTHRGLVRPNNEDGYLIRAVERGGYLVAVADGIGGGPAGQEASRIALEALDDAVGTDVQDVSRLAAAVSLANRRVYESGQQDDMLAGMGTTLTSAVIFPDRLYLAHVGDSRAYQVEPDHLVRLTIDHSLAAEMERAGGLTADEARRHPNRNVLTRAVGPFDRVRIDVADMPWNPVSRLLLCTDGLTSVLSDDDIFRLCQKFSGYELIDELIGAALLRGGPDNITVVLAEDVRDPGENNGR